MKEQYNRSLQKIKELKGFISIKKWNEIAKKEDLLSTRSLSYISKKSFVNLCNEIRKQDN